MDFYSDMHVKKLKSCQRFKERATDAIARCYGEENLQSNIKIDLIPIDLRVELNAEETVIITFLYETDPDMLPRLLELAMPRLRKALKLLEINDSPKKNSGLALILLDCEDAESIQNNWLIKMRENLNSVIIRYIDVDQIEWDCDYLKRFIEF